MRIINLKTKSEIRKNLKKNSIGVLLKIFHSTKINDLKEEI